MCSDPTCGKERKVKRVRGVRKRGVGIEWWDVKELTRRGIDSWQERRKERKRERDVKERNQDLYTEYRQITQKLREKSLFSRYFAISAVKSFSSSYSKGVKQCVMCLCFCINACTDVSCQGIIIILGISIWLISIWLPNNNDGGQSKEIIPLYKTLLLQSLLQHALGKPGKNVNVAPAK